MNYYEIFDKLNSFKIENARYRTIFNDLQKKYLTLKLMNKISKRGCSENDVLYRQFLLGEETILDDILKDLKELEKIRNE